MAKKSVWPLALTGLLAFGSLTYLSTFNQPTSLERRVRFISFDQAKKDVSLRSTYLNELLLDKSVHLSEWKYFHKIIYDHDTSLIQQAAKEMNFPLPSIPGELKDYLLCTTPKIGTTTFPCYVHQLAFKMCALEGDLLVILDHEAKHGEQHARGIEGWLTLKDMEMDQELSSLITEIVAFEYSFRGMHNGHRKVSPYFIQNVSKIARKFYKRVHEISQQDTPLGETAKTLLDELQRKPTSRYFK